MKTDELRKCYLDFFRAKEHRVYPSDSLVPVNDASLLFTGAGMNQFKPYFLGLKKDVKRATSCQKCLRTADLERVGKTAYHHSFFEMLGNFSFGDYFKEEAIVWGWEFVTKVLKLPENKLWVSVYEEDDEAFNIWKNKIGLPESKIVRMGPEDNFWPANAPKDGPNGPCGPCSEIYVGETPGKGVEIWNLVFTQYDRQSDGSLIPLPQKNIDTGMGLERTASVLQGVESNFDIDIFKMFRTELRTLLKKDAKFSVAHENAVMDHARAAVFSIADGALPSNEGRGYVVRKLIRLGCDHLTQAGAEPGQFKKTVAMVARMMGGAYPEVLRKQSEITLIVENEERSFLEVIRTQLPKLKELLQSADSNESAKIGFKFYDTYGLPFELIQASAAAVQKSINKAEFDRLMDEQKDRSRASSKMAGEIFTKSDWYALVEGIPNTEFLGYTGMKSTSKLLRIVRDGKVVNSLSAGDGGVFIFDKSPFYAESGGQIGDMGKIKGRDAEADVTDTLWHEKVTLHKVALRAGRVETGSFFDLEVDEERRMDIMRNHTGTHLLHAALRKVLGEHVKQSGSLVAPDYLRFDFTHFRGVDAESLKKIEELVNAEIQKNTSLHKQVTPKEEAIKRGAIAFFGEKYEDDVRVITIGDFSKELCGGTHLDSTGQIGAFKIVSESSIQAGVRRIVAVTGRWAEKKAREGAEELQVLAKEFADGKEEGLLETLHARSEELRAMRDRLDQAVLTPMQQNYEKYFKEAGHIGEATFFKRQEPFASPDLFQKTHAHLKNLKTPFVVLWQCGGGQKVSFAVGCSADLATKGFHSGNVVKTVAKVVEGNGGGRPDFAVGGGKRGDKVAEAIAVGEKAIAESLTQMREG